MTRRTLPAQPQEGILPLFQLRVIDKVGNVALAAIYFTVRPRQFITRQVVVEVFFIEPHHVEFSSVVFAVAFGAVFTSGLPGSVVARLPIDEALYFFVAIQAFIIGDFLSQRMALRTIGYPFQAGMRVGQRPGGQLGMQSRKE